VAFGLKEGISLLTYNGKEYSHKIIPRPTTLDPEARIVWIKTHILEPKFVVRTNVGGYLGTLDPVTEDWNFTQLPTTFSQFGFDGTGNYFMVLGTDGILYSIDVETLKIKETLRVYEPNKDLPAQAMTLGKAHAWITDPSNNSILFISLEEMEIEGTFKLPVEGNLDSIAIIETIGVAH
jgi:streptogramin lyase